MNREEIIKLAREAGFETMLRKGRIWGFDLDGDYTEEIERFAALVAAEKDAEIARLRTLCQEMLSELYVYRASEYLKDVTAAIRARGETK